MRVLHIITGLEADGAETMLKRLIESDPATISSTVVVSLTSIGTIGKLLLARGVSVHSLEMSSALSSPVAFWRLVRLIRQYKPGIVQTWMYHADLIGSLAARMAGVSTVVWGIRATSIFQGPVSVTFWVIRLCALFSYFIPDRIICCAKSAKTAHIKLGYAAHKIIVIPNGYDFSVFDRHVGSRNAARQELGFDGDELVIGTVGRFDPMKDFHNFVSAAAGLVAKHGKIKFLMVGRNIEWSNQTLRGWIEDKGLRKHFHLVGEQSDVPYFLSAMDIFCLSSINEAFPNVVAEAMAMGLPCVVTRAGDAGDILGADDFVVPVKDPVALHDALLRMCNLAPELRKKLGVRGAKKVRAEYEIKHVRQKFEDVYLKASSK